MDVSGKILAMILQAISNMFSMTFPKNFINLCVSIVFLFPRLICSSCQHYTWLLFPFSAVFSNFYPNRGPCEVDKNQTDGDLLFIRCIFKFYVGIDCLCQRFLQLAVLFCLDMSAIPGNE